MLSTSSRVLVVGATGLIGRAFLEHVMATAPDLAVTGWARRQPDFPHTAQVLSVDVADPASCLRAVEESGPVTHLVYAAVTAASAQIDAWSSDGHRDHNTAMLSNVLDAVTAGRSLEHVTILQGTKAYGSQFPTYQLPAREDDPRTVVDNFYYEQEDLLIERAAQGGFAWTILRPQVVMGYARGAAMNIVSCVGAYAALCREAGVPFRFPGSDLHTLWQAVDSRLVAEVIAWAQESTAARNQMFNVNNGDCSTWESTWLDVGALLGLPYAPPQRYPLASAMPRQSRVWSSLAEREELVVRDLAEVASWPYADYVLNKTANSYASRIKLHEAGFTRVMDTRNTWAYWLERLQADRVLPRFEPV
jgi:nucleoside-diphosphate-sugar epimerase